MKAALAVIALVAAYVLLFGVPRFLTGGMPRAYVECLSSGNGMTCTIQHQGGSKPIHACWDMVISCAGSQSVSGHGCGDVAPEAKSSVLMPLASFAGIEQCQASGAKVENVQLTEL